MSGRQAAFTPLWPERPLLWVVLFAPLALVFLLSFRIKSMSVGAAQLSFWAYAGLVGLSLSGIFVVYTGESIARVFFISAAAFGATSFYGYMTRTDLSRFGSFLFMGLIGIIVATLVNIFLASSALQFAISSIGVLVFTGLTAYDTQRIKEIYIAGEDGAIANKKAIMGALALYLDFLNLFLILMQLFGVTVDRLRRTVWHLFGARNMTHKSTGFRVKCWSQKSTTFTGFATLPIRPCPN
jgi:FtsH-binding integral membrane protein